MTFLRLLLLALCCFTLSAQAQTATPPSIGDGSSGNPYQIATLNNLYWLTQTSTAWDKHFVQTTDIDASATKQWDDGDGGDPEGFLPIGNFSTTFTGSYDGQGFKIDSLTINRPTTSGIGFFAATSAASISNLYLKHVSITGNMFVGALVGNNASSTLEDCFSSGSVTGNQDVGGLVGYNRYASTIDKGFSSCTVSSTIKRVGGLVGYNSTSTIIYSASKGFVTGVEDVGGLVGANWESTIRECYSLSNVSGSEDVGGLIGYNNHSIRYCWSAGEVSGTTNVGGLVGRNINAIVNNFWDMETSNQPTSSNGGTGKTTAEMKTDIGYLIDGWPEYMLQFDYQINFGYPFIYGLPYESDEMSIPANYTDAMDFDNNGVTVQFQTGNPNTTPLNLSIQQTDSEPGIVGSLPGLVENLSPRYWTANLQHGSVNGTYDITFDISGIPGISSCSDLYVLKRADGNSPWIDVETLGGVLEFSKCPDSLIVRGLTSFSDFVIGGGSDNPLPVELATFTGKIMPGGIALNWKTFTETDNLGFVVLRNGNPVASYASHARLKGQGTSLQETIYSFLDKSVHPENTYTYQLQSVDYSGQTHNYNQTVTLTLQQPQAYELSQNYPNPFNPTTTIRFVMKETGKATLMVFDMLGREVFEETLQAEKGEHSLTFNGDHLTSGMYFYRLTTENFSKTMKMMLVK